MAKCFATILGWLFPSSDERAKGEYHYVFADSLAFHAGVYLATATSMALLSVIYFDSDKTPLLGWVMLLNLPGALAVAMIIEFREFGVGGRSYRRLLNTFAGRRSALFAVGVLVLAVMVSIIFAVLCTTWLLILHWLPGRAAWVGIAAIAVLLLVIAPEAALVLVARIADRDTGRSV
jgi:hypothetical protein